MSTMSIWLNAARPRTLPAAAAPVIMGGAMAWADGHIAWMIFSLTLLSATFIQIGTNFANDYFDFRTGVDTTDRVGPIRATAAGLVSPRTMAIATGIAFGIAVAAGTILTYTGGLPILIIGICSVLCGILYTAGPFPLSYIGLGELFVILFFGPVATGGTYYLCRHSFSLQSVIAGLAPGFFSAAILIVNNYRDRFTDKKTGKNSLIVRFGEGFGRIEYAACLIAAFFIPPFLALSSPGHIGSLIAFFAIIPAIPPLKAMLNKPDAPHCNQLLGETGRLLLIYTLLFAAGWFL